MALECELYNRRFNRNLLNLYANPSVEGIKALHRNLIASKSHLDREVAFWLEPALEQTQIKLDVTGIIMELRGIEMELSSLLGRVNPSMIRDINDWLDYIANAGHSVEDEDWLGAKIFMSNALQSSKADSVEKIKTNVSLRYALEVLQGETLKCFDQIKKAASTVKVPEERLNVIVELQAILVELMRKYYLEGLDERAGDLIHYPIQKLSIAIQYLMRFNIKTERASQEIMLASQHLEETVKETADRKTQELAKKTYEKIKTVSKQLPATPNQNQ